jgi:hypothetical protein
MGVPQAPPPAQPPSTYHIRRLLAVVAAAARARVTGTLIKKGTEGPPPLPSSSGSQIFVVGGGARELVVLVVVSREHGGNSGQGPRLGSHLHLGVHEEHCFCLLHQTGTASPNRQPCLLSFKCVLPPPSGRSCFLKLIMIPTPSNPYQGCLDNKDQEQRDWTDR